MRRFVALGLLALIWGCGAEEEDDSRSFPIDSSFSEVVTVTTPTTAADPSECPWIGEWVVDAAHCAGVDAEEAVGWLVSIEAVDGEPEACVLIVDGGSCTDRIQLEDPSPLMETWAAWSDGGCSASEPYEMGPAQTRLDGDHLLMAFPDGPVRQLEGCGVWGGIDLAPL